MDAIKDDRMKIITFNGAKSLVTFSLSFKVAYYAPLRLNDMCEVEN